jgi:hypothetical protein
VDFEANRPDGVSPALQTLEQRRACLCNELARLERRIRTLRHRAEACPHCGGTGSRWVRGGLYGELQPIACTCGSRSRDEFSDDLMTGEGSPAGEHDAQPVR